MRTYRLKHVALVTTLALLLTAAIACTTSDRQDARQPATGQIQKTPAAAPAGSPAAGQTPANQLAPASLGGGPPLSGVDFVKYARQWFRVAACSGTEPLPGTVDP